MFLRAQKLFAYSALAQSEGRTVMGRKFVLTLVIGISAGFSFAYVLLTSSGFTKDVSMYNFR